MKYYNHADAEKNKSNFFMKDIKLKTDNQFLQNGSTPAKWNN
jgi:hypothetical protein